MKANSLIDCTFVIYSLPSAHHKYKRHPTLDTFIRNGVKPSLEVAVSAYHPDVDVEYAEGNPISSKHPSIQQYLARYLPDSHPNVDDQLKDPVS